MLIRIVKISYCNRLSPKCKSQLKNGIVIIYKIVTDYRLNANHNQTLRHQLRVQIVTDYRLNANHNCQGGHNHSR